MKNEKTSKILFIIFYVLAMISFVLNIVLGCALMVERDKAYADFNDLSSDAFINFNQMVENSYINYTGASSITVVSNLNYDTNDKLYIRATNSGGEFIVSLYNTNNEQLAYQGNGSVDLIVINNDYRNIIRTYTATGVNITNFNIYNLTKTFGSGNEPSLEDCHSLYIADSYSYNEGTTINLSGINSYELGYQNGFNDAWESQNITYRQNLINMASFPYNFGTYNLSQKYYSDVEQVYGFRGYLGVPLYTLDAGTNISLEFTFLCPDWQGESLTFKQSFNLYVYVLDNSNLTLFATISYSDIEGTYGTYKGSFVLPIQTNTIYINFATEPYNYTNTPTQVFAFESNATFRVADIGLAIENAFNSGYNKAIERYSYGGDKYLEIYNAGVADAEQNGSVFQSSWDFIGSAFNGVGQLLAVELFPNVPIGIFVAFPLLLGLIFFIVKLTKGGS